MSLTPDSSQQSAQNGYIVDLAIAPETARKVDFRHEDEGVYGFSLMSGGELKD